MDLSHIESEDLKQRILDMLAKNSHMWDGKLGRIRATEHQIFTRPGTQPIRQQP